MSTVIISLLSGLTGMFGWGVYDFYGGLYSKKVGPYKTLFWSQLAGFISILVLFFVLGAGLLIPISIIFLLPIAALFYIGGYLFFMRGLAIGNISIVAATMNLWAVFTMLFAFVFLGQRLSIIESIGVLMIILGAMLSSLNWEQIKRKTFKFSLGIRETVIGAFLFGVTWNLSEIITEEIGWLQTTLFIKAGGVLVLCLLCFLTKREIHLRNTSAGISLMIILIGLVEVVTISVVNFGLSVGDGILITPIASALSVVTITLALIILKETITKIQSLGIVLAISGIVVTAI